MKLIWLVLLNVSLFTASYYVKHNKEEMHDLIFFLSFYITKNQTIKIELQARVACRVYYRWLFLTACSVTLRSGGHNTNTVYFSDRGHVPVEYEDCFDFFQGHGVNNLPVIAK